MAKRKLLKNINEKEYNQIKTLLNTSLEISQVSLVTGRSRNSILYIKKSEDFKDYRKNTIARYTKTNEKRSANKQRISLTTNNHIPKVLNETMLFERLVEATEKIAYSLEQLNETAKKKKRIL